VLDPAPTRAGADELFALADVVTPNEHEAADLCGSAVRDVAAARSAAQALRNRGARTVIVTLGAAGAWVESEEHSLHVPAPAVQPVATVGAGDAFNGALAGGLALALGLEAAVRIAVVAGALCVTRPGAQAAMPMRAEIEARLVPGE
jgi:ribokinase